MELVDPSHTTGLQNPSQESTSGRILVVDDDAELCKLVARFLSAEGFRVETVRTSSQGLERARSGEHDLIVLDVMLPGMDGFEILPRLRAESRAPVLMLTARGDDLDRILGLENWGRRLPAETVQPSGTCGPHPRHPATREYQGVGPEFGAHRRGKP